MQLSFDEWNVWYLKEHQERQKAAEASGEWSYAPRLLEDVYSVADAVVVGNLLMTLLKHSDRVTSASLAQLVNVIAPIMTEPGGPAWRQTTFFPFSITSRLASGEVIRPVIETPTYATARHGGHSVIDAVATVDDGRAACSSSTATSQEPRGSRLTCAVSPPPRSSRRSRWPTPTSTRRTRSPTRSASSQPRTRARPSPAGVLTIELPPVSWTAAALS